MKKPTLLIFGEGRSIHQKQWDFEDQYHIHLAQKEQLLRSMLFQQKPDMVLLLEPSRSSGLAFLHSLSMQFPDCIIVCQADKPSNELIIEAFRSGASDFIAGALCPHSIYDCLSRAKERYAEGRNIPSLRLAGFPPVPKSASFASRFRQGFLSIFNRPSEPEDQHPDPISLLPPTTYPKPYPSLQLAHPPIQEEPKDVLQVNLLGDFCVMIDGENLTQSLKKKSKSLLSYILFHHERPLSKDQLMEAFWPKTAQESAKNCLHVTIHQIRKAFHALHPSQALLLFQDECYFLNPDLSIESDAAEFVRHWKQGRSNEHLKHISEAIPHYLEAIQQYRGDLMETQLYESWCQEDRENLKEIFLVILERLCEYYSTTGEWNKVILYGRQILDRDNCREQIHRSLMRGYHEMGNKVKALKQYHCCCQVLSEELETSPTKATVNLFEQIKGERS